MQRGWLLTLVLVSALLLVSATADAASEPAGAASSEPVLALPAASGDGSTPSVALGDTFKFDHLGPIIINSDGTTRRITNWENLTEHERTVALRRIAQRNKQRIDTLKLQEQEQAAGEAKAAEHS